MNAPEEILNFWFEEIKPAQWWVKDPNLDQFIRRQFSAVHQQATRCELFHWRKAAKGCLAEIIVLDQFSRNMYRDTPLAFTNDSLALALAQIAVERGIDQQLSAVERSFLYMPYMHSESLAIHDVGVELFRQKGLENSYDIELKHRAIIERFGRYPHRNVLLGRESTAEELWFLQELGSSF